MLEPGFEEVGILQTQLQQCRFRFISQLVLVEVRQHARLLVAL